MPPITFMERDVRRDHALTRPDPRRAQAIGAPDACTTCHQDRSVGWAAEEVETWWGTSPAREAQRGLAVTLAAGRAAVPAAAAPLCALVSARLDPIRRASAVRLLASWIDEPATQRTLVSALDDPEALVRAAAVRTLGEGAIDADVRARLVTATHDPRRLVRIEAAFALRAVDPETLADTDARAAVRRANGEWLAAQAVLDPIPESHFNRGLYWAARGDVLRAEAAYRTATRLWPYDPTPRHNLAQLLLDGGRAADAEHEWRALLAADPGWPSAALALATLVARDERWDEAAALLDAGLARAPDYPRAAYTLGVVERARGRLDAAAAAFERATEDPAARREALRELVRLAHARGDEVAQQRWLPETLLADPTVGSDPDVRSALGLPAGAASAMPGAVPPAAPGAP